MPKVKFKPNNQSPETILIHANWKLERAIRNILEQAGRPLSVYEIQWESNRVFGATFEKKKLDAIKNCLQNDDLFVRNPQGDFQGYLRNVEHAIQAHAEKRDDELSSDLKDLHKFLAEQFKEEIEYRR